VVKRKILIHLSDRDKWQSAVWLVGALMENKEADGLEIVIIADVFAGAVCLHCNQSLKQQMTDLAASGQQILVCEESLKCLNIPLKSLPDFAQTIPLSLPEIIRLKEEGFHYIKL
jgi:intracellular sulfur oxidation DsrE/DsrF family protein